MAKLLWLCYLLLVSWVQMQVTSIDWIFFKETEGIEEEWKMRNESLLTVSQLFLSQQIAIIPHTCPLRLDI